MSLAGHDHDSSTPPDPLLKRLHSIIKFSLRALAILMTFVIVWGIFDVLMLLYVKLSEPPFLLLDISDILATFGAFMAVLIAIEIFVNITMYLEEGVLHVKLVLATALMAAARKVIVMDFKRLDYPYVFALAAVILALGIAYWLNSKCLESEKTEQCENSGKCERRERS